MAIEAKAALPMSNKASAHDTDDDDDDDDDVILPTADFSCDALMNLQGSCRDYVVE